jgi:prolyl 4-hydroxylase
MAAGGADLMEGIERITAAASDGNSEALYLMALLVASGIGLPQDLGASLQHLQRAAEAGHRQAQTDLAALVGNWRLVGEIAAGKMQRPESWDRLRAAVDIAGWLRVPEGRIFSEEPRIAAVKQYVSPPICEWLIRLGRPHLEEAEIYDSESGALRGDSSRTNSAAPLGLEQIDMVVAFVRARISTLANVSIEGLETSQVLHYQVGQEFAAHCDYLDVNNPGHARDVAMRGQRALTVLIYLNDDYSGGDTSFPMLGRSFKGRKGDALIFWNLAQDGAPDGRTLHIGTAPTHGEKWLFSQWIRIPAS